jgi:hypothetical protein
VLVRLLELLHGRGIRTLGQAHGALRGIRGSGRGLAGSSP